MTDRVARILRRQESPRIEICAERAEIMVPVLLANAGRPPVVQRARAVAEYLKKRTLFIELDELIIGNLAEKPMGMEADPMTPCWPEEDLEDMLHGYQLYMSEETKNRIKVIDQYARGCGRTKAERKGAYYDDERLWPFIQKGFLNPGWRSKTVGRGNGFAGCGWGFPGVLLFCPDFEKILATGFEAKLREVQEARRALRFVTREDVYKADFYEAAEILLQAMMEQSLRYAALAEEMAQKEPDKKRAEELRGIADICRRIPAKPAGTFREAIQFFFFYWCYALCGTEPGARFDQFMYPYYKADLEAGRITREEALELIELLRLKIMQYGLVGGGKEQREKWAGMARWHNFILGGCDRDGNDITNEISYLMLDAAQETMTPHPTLTVRVSEKTPPAFLRRALEVVRTGIGMPAFISEKSYINFLLKYDVPLADARDFAIAGCLDVQIPGRSRNNAFGMFIVPLVLELAMNNGSDPVMHHFFGEATGEMGNFRTFDSFYDAFLTQLRLTVGMANEEHNIAVVADGDAFPDALVSVFCDRGVEYGRDMSQRPMIFENGSVCNMVGMVCVINSLAAIKKVVFEDKQATMAQLHAALAANWEGYEALHQLCLAAPKFGNNDPYVDAIAAKLWDDYAAICGEFTTAFGAPLIPTATSITAHVPAGATVGATPDGRMAGDTLSDGSISPAQGDDLHGPLAVLQSGMAIDQDQYMATLLNMKFLPDALKTPSDLDKLGMMIRTYLTNGGKHVQFNVVSAETLQKAQQDPEKYRSLIVRVAGYSAYFSLLQHRVQDEIIHRTAHEMQ